MELQEKALIKCYENEVQVSLAWFKLAELVTRGEKERALSIYRLLHHSWNNEAYAAQLRGDLYCAFRDYDKAREAYYQAVAAYDASSRLLQAAFVFERLIQLESYSFSIYLEAIARFAELGCEVQVARYVEQLCACAREQQLLEQCVVALRDVVCSAPAYACIERALDREQLYTTRAATQARIVGVSRL